MAPNLIRKVFKYQLWSSWYQMQIFCSPKFCLKLNFIIYNKYCQLLFLNDRLTGWILKRCQHFSNKISVLRKKMACSVHSSHSCTDYSTIKPLHAAHLVYAAHLVTQTIKKTYTQRLRFSKISNFYYSINEVKYSCEMTFLFFSCEHLFGGDESSDF